MKPVSSTMTSVACRQNYSQYHDDGFAIAGRPCMHDTKMMRSAATLLFLGVLANCLSPQNALSPSETSQVSPRRAFLHTVLTGAACLADGGQPGWAATKNEGNHNKIQDDEELKRIVKADIVERQFLVTGDLTRSIYQPTATFTDEIDTYQMDQWMKGTQRLFVGEKSDVRLVGDVEVSAEKVEFRFDEDLMFRIPFRPVVSLTGKVVLKRDESSGLITSYQELWDQDVVSVLRTAKF